MMTHKHMLQHLSHAIPELDAVEQYLGHRVTPVRCVKATLYLLHAAIDLLVKPGAGRPEMPAAKVIVSGYQARTAVAEARHWVQNCSCSVHRHSSKIRRVVEAAENAILALEELGRDWE